MPDISRFFLIFGIAIHFILEDPLHSHDNSIGLARLHLLASLLDLLEHRLV